MCILTRSLSHWFEFHPNKTISPVNSLETDGERLCFTGPLKHGVIILCSSALSPAKILFIINHNQLSEFKANQRHPPATLHVQVSRENPGQQCPISFLIGCDERSLWPITRLDALGCLITVGPSWKRPLLVVHMRIPGTCCQPPSHLH